jgi:hypothetical protein
MIWPILWSFLPLSSSVWFQRQLPPNSKSFRLASYQGAPDTGASARVLIGASSWPPGFSFPVRLLNDFGQIPYMKHEGDDSENCTQPPSKFFDPVAMMNVTRAFATADFDVGSTVAIWIQGCRDAGSNAGEYSAEVHFSNEDGSYLEARFAPELISRPITLSVVFVLFAPWLFFMLQRKFPFDLPRVAFAITGAYWLLYELIYLIIVYVGVHHDLYIDCFRAIDWLELLSIPLVLTTAFLTYGSIEWVGCCRRCMVVGYIISEVVYAVLLAGCTQLQGGVGAAAFSFVAVVGIDSFLVTVHAFSKLCNRLSGTVVMLIALVWVGPPCMAMPMMDEDDKPVYHVRFTLMLAVAEFLTMLPSVAFMWPRLADLAMQNAPMNPRGQGTDCHGSRVYPGYRDSGESQLDRWHNYPKFVEGAVPQYEYISVNQELSSSNTQAGHEI